MIFKLGINKIRGRIENISGIPSFVTKNRHPEPLYMNIDPSNYGKPCEAYIRTYDHAFISELGNDDIIGTDNIPPNTLIIRSNHELEYLIQLLDKRKEHNAIALTSTIAMICGSIFASFLFYRIFDHPLLVKIFLCFLIPLSFTSIIQIRHILTTKIYDKAHNWVDVKTGKTSLDKGTFKFNI